MTPAKGGLGLSGRVVRPIGALVAPGTTAAGFVLYEVDGAAAAVKWGPIADRSVDSGSLAVFDVPGAVVPTDVLRLPLMAIQSSLTGIEGSRAKVVGGGLLADMVQTVLQNRGCQVVPDGKAELMVAVVPDAAVWAPLAARLPDCATIVLFVPPESPPQTVDVYSALHRPSLRLRAARWHHLARVGCPPPVTKLPGDAKGDLTAQTLEELWARWVSTGGPPETGVSEDRWQWIAFQGTSA